MADAIDQNTGILCQIYFSVEKYGSTGFLSRARSAFIPSLTPISMIRRHLTSNFLAVDPGPTRLQLALIQRNITHTLDSPKRPLKNVFPFLYIQIKTFVEHFVCAITLTIARYFLQNILLL